MARSRKPTQTRVRIKGLKDRDESHGAHGRVYLFLTIALALACAWYTVAYHEDTVRATAGDIARLASDALAWCVSFITSLARE